MFFNNKTILCACILATVVIGQDSTFIYNFQTNKNMKLIPSSVSTNLSKSCAFTGPVTITPVWTTVNNVTTYNTLTAAGPYNTTLAACHNLNLNYTLLQFVNNDQMPFSSNSTMDLLGIHLEPQGVTNCCTSSLLDSIQSTINNEGVTTSIVYIQLLILTPGTNYNTYVDQIFTIDFSDSSTSGSKLSALFGVIALISLLAF